MGENLEVEKEGLMEDALKWREKKDELGLLVEEFKEKLKKHEIEKEDAANWREEKAELEMHGNKLREEKAELTTTKVELQLALRQARLLILKKNKKKRTESIREGKESLMKDMQARTKSPKHEGQNHQGEDHGWKRKKSPVDASPLLERYQKDGKRKFTETNFQGNERKMKKSGRKRAKTDIEKAELEMNAIKLREE